MIFNTFEINEEEDIARSLACIRSVSALPAEVLASVQEIIDDVRLRGDDALIDLTRQFDGADLGLAELEVPARERTRALALLDADTRSALEFSATRISAFARAGLIGDSEQEVSPGIVVGTVRRPLDRAGIYVPGGRFPYPSTVLMTGIPAREAGVKEICLCVPPGADGSVNAATLAATAIIGECRVFKVGGAQAIAAMAFGTGTIPQVQIIAGPGNIYVTAAKRLLSHVVSIDLEAGPSEVAVLVDGSAEPDFAAADMLAQLEHDPLSLAVVASDSTAALTEVQNSIERLAAGGSAAGSISLVGCRSRGLAVSFLNGLAPEHLELIVEDAGAVLEGVTSAGCVFTGRYSAVALGDYVAGPSHVLPTGGTAARLSGLSVADFSRAMNTVSYSREGFCRDAEKASLLARLEGLERHAASLDIRRRSNG